MTNNLPNGWEMAKLEDVVDILDSKRVPINSKEREARRGQVPYYGATGQVGWIDDFLFDEELVLLGEDGAPFFDSSKQKAYVIRGRSWVNNHAHVLRAKNGIPNAYIKHYLDIVDYHGFVTGTTRLKLNQAAMRQIPVPIAPPDQQKRIVAEIEKQFSRLDEAVANLKRVKANLKRYKAAVLKAAVEGRLVETEAERARREGRNYETGDQLLQRILETRRSQWQGKGKYKEPATPDTTGLPELPEGWVWASAEQVCGSVRDGTHDTPAYVETGVPLITSKNLTGEGIDFDNVKLISESDHVEISRRSGVEAGDILFAMIGTIGNPCEIKTDVQFSIKNVGLFKRNSTFIESAYLCYWLSAPPFDKWLAPRLKGTTQKFAPLGLLREVPVPLQPVREQQRIVAEVDRRLSLIHETVAQVDASLKRAGRLQQTILRVAFLGHITEKCIGS